MIYLVLSSLCLALLYGVYRLALSRTTLHRFNRFILLSILVFSAVLPAVRLNGVHFDFNKVGQETYKEVLYATESSLMADVPEFDWASEPDETVTEYAPTQEASVPVQKADVKTRVALGVRIMEGLMQMDIVRIITYLYLMGVVFFMIRLLVGIIRAETLCRLGGRELPDGSKLLVCDGEFQPTSWRRTVIMSRRDFESAEKDIIIEHELTHIHCHHSIDVVISQLACALQWFNPAAWALKRSLQEVHEYEADAAVLADGENERRYQICLVQAALGNRVGYVTSNFADCSTKKRIKMMKRNQSSPFACLRVLLMLPVVLVTILLASACKPKASQDNTAAAQSEPVAETVTQAVLQLEPVDTTFLKKFGYGSNEDIKIKQLNVFVEIEWDGAIWMTFDGEQTFHPATIDNFAAEFEHLKKESTVEVARPDLVFVTIVNDEHLDIVESVIRQLQKSYSDDKILLINLPGRILPPPPAASEYNIEYNLDFETDKWVRIIIDRRNHITMIAHNITRKLDSPQDLKPTIESFATITGTDSVAIEIKADNTVVVRVPEFTKAFGTPDALEKELKRLYPDVDDEVYWMVTFDVRCSTRVENEVNDIFKQEPFKDHKVRVLSQTRKQPAISYN